MKESEIFLNTYSHDVLEKYNEIKWRIIKQKISLAEGEAVRQGDMVLATILRHAHQENLESFYHEMDRHDYNFEIHMPPDTMNITEHEINFDFSGMKLVIWKKVMEF